MSEWINVKDKMPEKDGRYLVNEHFHGANWVGVMSLRNGKWDINVTHWQELPKPPEVEA